MRDSTAPLKSAGSRSCCSRQKVTSLSALPLQMAPFINRSLLSPLNWLNRASRLGMVDWDPWGLSSLDDGNSEKKRKTLNIFGLYDLAVDLGGKLKPSSVQMMIVVEWASHPSASMTTATTRLEKFIGSFIGGIWPKIIDVVVLVLFCLSTRTSCKIWYQSGTR